MGQKLSKLSLKDHCSRDPVQVQSGNKVSLAGAFAPWPKRLGCGVRNQFPMWKFSHKILLGEEDFQGMKTSLSKHKAMSHTNAKQVVQCLCFAIHISPMSKMKKRWSGEQGWFRAEETA